MQSLKIGLIWSRNGSEEKVDLFTSDTKDCEVKAFYCFVSTRPSPCVDFLIHPHSLSCFLTFLSHSLRSSGPFFRNQIYWMSSKLTIGLDAGQQFHGKGIHKKMPQSPHPPPHTRNSKIDGLCFLNFLI